MQLERFTTKAQAALQAAQKIANQHSNQEIEGEHLLAALLEPEDGLIRPLLQKLGVPVSQLLVELEQAIERRVKVQGGSSTDTFPGRDLKRAFDAAESQAAKLKDDYVSTEHLLLGLLAEPNPALKKLFKSFSIKTPEVLKALAELQAWLAWENLKGDGTPIYGYFDPPWTPSFLRRNEVMLRVTTTP